MPRYVGKSATRLYTGVHPDLVALHDFVVRIYDNSIACGYRSNEQQQKEFDAGTSKVKPGKSKHNNTQDGQPLSLAVDSYPYIAGVGAITGHISAKLIDSMKFSAQYKKSFWREMRENYQRGRNMSISDLPGQLDGQNNWGYVPDSLIDRIVTNQVCPEFIKAMRDYFELGRFAGIKVEAARQMNMPIRVGDDWDGDGNTIDTNFLDAPHTELMI